jgi:hypothetical protein
MPLTVTFDTNTLDSVVWPETAQSRTGTSGAEIQAAIKAGHIQGFFSETLVTLEGIPTKSRDTPEGNRKKDRPAVLGSSQLVSSSSFESENSITIKLAFQQNRDPFDAKFSERIQAARSLGIRALMVPRLLGSGVCANDDDGTFFEPIGDLEQFVARAVHLRSEIGARGIGHAAAIKLGLDRLSQPGLWYEGLLHASRNKVKEAVAEWADGDSLVAHYGYAIDLFCSRDCGKNAGKASVLHPGNRQWLSEEYGIQFVTLAELAKRATT